MLLADPLGVGAGDVAAGDVAAGGDVDAAVSVGVGVRAGVAAGLDADAGGAATMPSHGRQITSATTPPTRSTATRTATSRRRRYTAGECRRTGRVLTLSG